MTNLQHDGRQATDAHLDSGPLLSLVKNDIPYAIPSERSVKQAEVLLELLGARDTRDLILALADAIAVTEPFQGRDDVLADALFVSVEGVSTRYRVSLIDDRRRGRHAGEQAARHPAHQRDATRHQWMREAERTTSIARRTFIDEAIAAFDATAAKSDRTSP